ncbi:hypothetical protein B0H11DRAFT_2089778 [Mycena galericulata]|nr:hypothetical protein B0H11DRAFT_2089778 [Mycena galericulata]
MWCYILKKKKKSKLRNLKRRCIQNYKPTSIPPEFHSIPLSLFLGSSVIGHTPSINPLGWTSASVKLPAQSSICQESYQHNRGNTETVEAQDNKVMQPLKVSSQMGESIELNGNHTLLRLPSLSVGFTLGTYFWNTNLEGIPVPPPRISSVNRHQIFIWVYDPECKIPIQGFVVVPSFLGSF